MASKQETVLRLPGQLLRERRANVARTAGKKLAFRSLRPDPQPLPAVLTYRQMAATPLMEGFVSAARSVQAKSHLA
jgi:hypothetical protein